MRITYFDVETTGLNPVTNDIIQVAYAIFDDNKCIRSEVMHFFYEGMQESAPEALEKHGMTYSYLSQYKDDFARNLHKLYAVLNKARVAGFNNDYFDNEFVQCFLRRHRAPDLVFKESIDIMKLATPIVHKNRISLINLCKYFEITPDEIKQYSNTIFGLEGKAHAAYYDVAATRLCHLKEIELIEGPAVNNETSQAGSDFAWDLCM